MRKFLIILVKYIPIVQMIGILLNNTLYYFDICRSICYTIDFTIGTSYMYMLLIYIFFVNGIG